MRSEGSWREVVDRLLEEAARNDARTDSFWAQQLAFGPVLFHALRLRLGSGPVPPEVRGNIGRIVALAAAALGPLPEEPGTDPAAVALLATRQARAVQWGRRRCLERLLGRLGQGESSAPGRPLRMLRHYPLIGWKPHERLAT